jgi:hypothetical protein
MKPHKWAKEIKAWADGQEIEMYKGLGDDIWDDAPNPNWNNSSLQYRIKPQPKEPQYLYVYKATDGRMFFGKENELIRFDGDYPDLITIGKIKLEEE